MKVAYIFATQGHTVSYKLGRMILPNLKKAGTASKLSECFSSRTTASL